MDVKRCPSCGVDKPSSDYGRNQSLGDGLSFYCLACNRAKSNAHYRKRRQALGRSVRDLSWVPENFRWCPSCERAVAIEEFGRSSYTTSGMASYCKPCKNAASSDAYFYRKYKLTQRELRALREAQQDRCGICGAAEPEHLDHDHVTGKIHMLLCQRCNQGLGLFRDEPYLLRVAALYVEGHRERQAIETLTDAARSTEDGPPGRGGRR